MRTGVLALVLVLAACGASQARTSTAHRPPARARCGPATARSLAVGPRARVYARSGFVSACTVLNRRITRLGRSNRCIAAALIRPVTVAGVLAAYGRETCGIDTGSATVVVRRLTDGVVLRSLAPTQGPLQPEGYRSVLSIVAKPDGAVAWIGQISSLASRQVRTEVLAADAGADERLLDSGAGIDTRSLALHGSQLTWRDGGSTRASTLQ